MQKGLRETEPHYRSHRLDEVDEDLIGNHLRLAGWVHEKRDLGGLIFVVLRDRFSRIQIVFDPDEVSEELMHEAHQLTKEDVIRVEGELQRRIEDQIVADQEHGDKELHAEELKTLARAEAMPFRIDEEVDADELTRLEYRFLDLRRPGPKEALELRHEVALNVREFFDRRDFLEIETPLLGRSTPEGARDFIIPSRMHKGEFYALPQSPQLYKQVLMISGVDRYFQLAKCLRDEDLRADRQLEHTQIDMEMSFTTRDELLALLEELFHQIFYDALDVAIPSSFERMTYREAISKYGTDKPDLRYGMEIQDLNDWAVHSTLNFIEDAVEEGQNCRALFVEDWTPSRSELDDLEEFAQDQGAQGLASLVYEGEEVGGSIAGPLDDKRLNQIREEFGFTKEDAGTVLFQIGFGMQPNLLLGDIRSRLIDQLDPPRFDDWKFLWVTDFPLFERDEDSPTRLTPSHHPFTMPLEEDLDKLELNEIEELLNIRADCYDLVLNGVELGSGSLRIWQPEIQRKVLGHLGMDEEEIDDKFGWVLDAYEYGAPPHRGIALGFDRIVALMHGSDSIRDVIAFPKTASATDPMTGAPTPVEPAQLRELGIVPVRQDEEQ